MSNIARSIVSFTLIIFFFGCTKDDRTVSRDDISMNKQEPRLNMNKAANKCQVVSMMEDYLFGIDYTTVFEYNKWGDPVSVTRYPRPAEATPNLYFTYDNKHRLTELFGMYSGNTGEFYTKYFYSGPGDKQVIMDSTYIFPVFQNGIMTSYYDSKAVWYIYDSQGRIIKDSTIWHGGSSANELSYSYDANGNRAMHISGQSLFFTYDNKVNLHVRNEIFQFLDRDYSVNNPFIAETYNSEGLPTVLNAPTGSNQYLRFIYFLHAPNVTFTYDCK
jgi:hypothetical protein